MTGEGDVILSHLISSYLILSPLSYRLGYPSFPHLHSSPSFHIIILIIPFHFTLYILTLPTY
jgi:hypothetical protein